MALNRRDKMFSPELRLSFWQADAAKLAICSDCFGSGEDRDRQGRACPTCEGAGRAVREPHVLELLRLEAEARQRADRAEAEAGELRLELDRVRGELYRLRDDRQRSTLAGALFESLLEAEAAVAADRLARKDRDE